VAFSHTDQLSQLDRYACRRWARGNNGLFPRAWGFLVEWSQSTP